jgi:fatty acid desaturase
MEFSYFYSCFLYISIVSICSIYSKSRYKTIKIPNTLIVDYNICNALINLYIVYGLYPYVCNSSLGMYKDYDEYVDFFIYMHYLTKYLDFCDTIIMILKQNWRQVNFLHIYHHSTIGVLWYLIWRDYSYISASVAFGAFLNSFIHFWMYIHYAITAMGYNNPFKTILTSLQMTQFSVVLCHSLYWIYCFPEYKYIGLIQTYYMLSMLILFYLYVYIKNTNIEYIVNNKNLHITIDGVTYDATIFASKHPGGNIINFYNRIDATNAFKTFHLRSEYAKNMLHTLPIISRIQYNNSDFNKLVTKWIQKGLYKGGEYKFIIWASVIFCITITGAIIQAFGFPIIGGIITGIGWAHCGFVQHHAGHRAFTGKPEIDYVVQGIFEGILKGGSGKWWRNRHNKHHAMPNAIGYDGDLRTTPFFAWDEVLIKKVPTILLRVQHILFIPLLIMYVPIFFITTKLYIIRKKLWDELGLIVIHFVLASLFCNNITNFLIFYIIGYAIQGLYLGIMFGLNHFAMPRINDKNTDWVEWQVNGTCNWGVGSKFAEYISGFLNLQIEHHLVPQMPAENYNLIIKDVKEYTKYYNIKYIEYSFYEAFYNMIYGLKKTADDELECRKNNSKIY